MGAQARSAASGSGPASGREQTAAFIRMAPFQLIMTDADLTLVEVSPAWTAQTGISREAAIGRPIYDILPHSAERFGPILARCLAGETVRFERARVELPDGRTPWYQIALSPWRDTDG